MLILDIRSQVTADSGDVLHVCMHVVPVCVFSALNNAFADVCICYVCGRKGRGKGK